MAEALARSSVAALLPDGSVSGGLTFTDLTLVKRAGVKVPGARAWLEKKGFGPLPKPNAAISGASGLLLAMLGETEALLLGTADGPPLWSFASGAALAPGAYPIPRGEGTFWITIAGPTAPEIVSRMSRCSPSVRPNGMTRGTTSRCAACCNTLVTRSRSF